MPLPSYDALAGRIQRAREKIRDRPPQAEIVPAGPGERSVWDFPRPPSLAPVHALLEVRLGDTLIAQSHQALEVTETSCPPVPYFRPDDLIAGELIDTEDWALCEWKGVGVYFDLRLPHRTVKKAGWRIPDPMHDLGRPYPLLKDWIAFLPAHFDCFRDGQPTTPQAGGYYGGWITPDLKGPFKGEPGTEDW